MWHHKCISSTSKVMGWINKLRWFKHDITVHCAIRGTKGLRWCSIARDTENRVAPDLTMRVKSCLTHWPLGDMESSESGCSFKHSLTTDSVYTMAMWIDVYRFCRDDNVPHTWNWSCFWNKIWKYTLWLVPLVSSSSTECTYTISFKTQHSLVTIDI